MKKMVILMGLFLGLIFLNGCATTSLTSLTSSLTGKITGIGSNGKYVGPVVTSQHGEKMVIPNGGLPGTSAVSGLLKAVVH